MNKIEKLTPEQEAKFPEYVKKWIDIGTDTSRLEHDKTEKIVNSFRKLINMEEAPLIIVENPIEAWVACCLVEHGVKKENLISEMKQVFHGNPKKYEIPEASLPYQTGSFFASVFSFYDYMLEELKIDIDKDLWIKYKTWESTSQIGCIYPLDNISIVCQKPLYIKLNENNVLHCDGGPALEYAGEGDFKVYALNGVSVPEYLAVTPSHQIDLDLYNKEENADVRAEFIRKVGIERFLDKGILMDTYKNYDQEEHEFWYSSEYELYDMKAMFPSLKSAPYLKMRNATTGIWHMEGVSPECTTVSQALKERFNGMDMKIVNMA